MSGRQITIGFSVPKRNKFPIYSWLIRLYEGTKFSHVYIKWDTKYGVPICYHAAHLMVHFLGKNQFDKTIKVVDEFHFIISDEQFEKLMEFCLKYAGSDYALMDVLKIPLMDLGLLDEPGDDPSKQYCAELVLRALAEINGDELTGSADRVKLKDIYKMVSDKHNLIFLK